MNRGVLESQAVKLHATYKIKFGSKKIRSNRHKHQSQVCLTFSKKKKKSVSLLQSCIQWHISLKLNSNTHLFF